MTTKPVGSPTPPCPSPSSPPTTVLPPSPPPSTHPQRPLYLTAFHHTLWEITDYLTYTLDGRHLSDTLFSQAIDGYIKSLEAIDDTDTERWSKAQELLRCYKTGNDRQRARDWRDKHRGEEVGWRRDKPAVTINNSTIELGDGAAFAVGGGAAANVHNINPPKKSKIKVKTKRKVRAKVKRTREREDSDSDGSHDDEAAGRAGWSSKSFLQTYTKMEKKYMWTLPSGAYVEDIIFDAFKDAGTESLEHSFVLDINNDKVQKLFEPRDWAAILECVPKWPPINAGTYIFMKEFMSLDCPASLRNKLLSKPYLPAGEKYDREDHFDQYWVFMVLSILIPLYENPSQPLQTPHDEVWYDIRLWGTIIDTILDDIPGLSVRRREVPCLSGAARKNRSRQDTSKRQRIGARFDGLVTDGSYEYAAMEGSRQFSGLNSTKWLSDYGRVAKALHDMMYRLQTKVDGDRSKLQMLTLAGVVTAGLHVQVLRLNYANGYVCLLSRDTLCEVPKMFDDLHLLFQLLGSVLRMKTLLTESKALIDGNGRRRSLIDFLKPASLTSASAPRMIIPMSCDTEEEGGESA